MKIVIPSLFTVFNLFCGILGIVFVFQFKLVFASYLIGLAVISDFLDGFVARILGATSEFGKQLDSLCDLVTFGVLPSLILFQLINITFGVYSKSLLSLSNEQFYISLIALLVAVASAIRLAIFNIDIKQTDGFLGVPVPASAIFIASLPIIMEKQYGMNLYFLEINRTILDLGSNKIFTSLDVMIINLMFQWQTYVIISTVLSILIVCRIPMLSFKFKNFIWIKNRARIIFLILVIILGIFTILPSYNITIFKIKYLIFPIIIILYILYSIILLLFNLKTKKNEI